MKANTAASFSDEYQRQYDELARAMQLSATLLQAASQFDSEIRALLAPLPEGWSCRIEVQGGDPAMQLAKRAGGLVKVASGRVDVCISYKHLSLAALNFNRQESGFIAFARGRVVLNGDLSASIRFTAVMNRLQLMLLPRKTAATVLKRVEPVPLARRVIFIARLAWHVALGSLGVRS